MCLPALAVPAAAGASAGMSTLQVASLAFSGAGAMMSAYSQVQQGKYNAAVSRNNKILADRNAKDALHRGQVEEAAQRRKTAALKGQQRAQMAASGVALDEGTPLSILEDTAALGELDALTIRSNAEREAYGFQVEGMNHEADARLSRSEGYSSATSSLLTGATAVASKWYKYTKD